MLKELDIDAKDNNGATALDDAASSVNGVSFVSMFIDRGAAVNSKDDNEDRPLHYALGVENNVATVKKLLKRGASSLGKNKQGITPLHVAAQLKKIEELKALIQGLPDPKRLFIDVKDKKGATPLMYACAQPDNAVVIEWLLKYKAKLNEKDSNGLDALDHALKIPQNEHNVVYLLNVRDQEDNFLLDQSKVRNVPEEYQEVYDWWINKDPRLFPLEYFQEKIEALRGQSPIFASESLFRPILSEPKRITFHESQ